MADLAAFFQHVQDHVMGIGQMMHAVCIVPHDLEIRRGGFHRGQPAHGFITVTVSVRIGIQRHAPDSLYRLILHKRFHTVHIRPCGKHGNGDKLKSEIFRHTEVTVVARRRAQKFRPSARIPRGRAIGKAQAPSQVDQVIHHIQAGVSAHDHLIRLCAQNIGKKAACLRHAFQVAVIARIDSRLTFVIRDGKQVHRKIQLVRRGFPA